MGKRSKIIRAIRKNPGEWTSAYSGAAYRSAPLMLSNGKELPAGWHLSYWNRSYRNLINATLKKISNGE